MRVDATYDAHAQQAGVKVVPETAYQPVSQPSSQILAYQSQAKGERGTTKTTRAKN